MSRLGSSGVEMMPQAAVAVDKGVPVRTGSADGGALAGPEASLPGGLLAPGQRRPLSPGYGKIRHLSPAVGAKTRELEKRLDYPIGTHIPLTIGGYDYLFAVEWHKHPPTDNVIDRLKDWHRGVSAYERLP